MIDKAPDGSHVASDCVLEVLVVPVHSGGE